MAKVFKATHFLALLFIVILLAGTEVSAAGKLCQRRSTTWFGVCIFSSNCNNQCKSWEHADHGGCHFDWRGSACFCYFNC